MYMCVCVYFAHLIYEEHSSVMLLCVCIYAYVYVCVFICVCVRVCFSFLIYKGKMILPVWQGRSEPHNRPALEHKTTAPASWQW